MKPQGFHCESWSLQFIQWCVLKHQTLLPILKLFRLPAIGSLKSYPFSLSAEVSTPERSSSLCHLNPICLWCLSLLEEALPPPVLCSTLPCVPIVHNTDATVTERLLHARCCCSGMNKTDGSQLCGLSVQAAKKAFEQTIRNKQHNSWKCSECHEGEQRGYRHIEWQKLTWRDGEEEASLMTSPILPLWDRWREGKIRKTVKWCVKKI